MRSGSSQPGARCSDGQVGAVHRARRGRQREARAGRTVAAGALRECTAGAEQTVPALGAGSVPVLSVILAVLAAVGNALASVLQRRAGADQPEDTGGLQLIWRLAHRPDWLAGIAALVVGFLLQAAALATGSVALVQPILVLELAFTLMLAQVVFRSRLHMREWSAIVGMSAGLASMLYALLPSRGDPGGVLATAWTIGISGMIAASAACALIGYRSSGARRAAFLGIATGIGFALTAVLVAGIGAEYGASGIAGLLTSPLTYLLIVLGPSFFFLLQRSLQAGSLVASQPALTLSNPIAAAVFGVVVFGEHVRTDGWLALAVAGAALVAVCTVVLTRSPLLAGGGEQDAAESGGERCERTR
jgi:drug/metabolite transporter (DMT)-like permease